MRTWLLMALALAGGCDALRLKAPACGLAEEKSVCPECYDGQVTCAFEGIEATAGSCQGCQARASLYQKLCAVGATVSAKEIVDGTTCKAVPPAVPPPPSAVPPPAP